jgi:hypothetical protein
MEDSERAGLDNIVAAFQDFCQPLIQANSTACFYWMQGGRKLATMHKSNLGRGLGTWRTSLLLSHLGRC